MSDGTPLRKPPATGASRVGLCTWGRHNHQVQETPSTGAFESLGLSDLVSRESCRKAVMRSRSGRCEQACGAGDALRRDEVQDVPALVDGQEARLPDAVAGRSGWTVGKAATVDALASGWGHWDGAQEPPGRLPVHGPGAARDVR